MLALIAFSIQAAVTAKFSPFAAGNPNVIVPSSTAVNMWDLHKPHTHYLVYHGTGQQHHGNTPEPSSLFGPLDLHASPPGYWPPDIRNAYDVSALRGASAIAIVDYSYYPTALADFNFFSKQFDLPVETSANATSSSNSVFQVVYEHGTQPTVDDTGWNGEEALDIEWAHAMAPNAKIYLVESDDGNLDLCDQIASALPGVKEVSNSWGVGGEYSTELSDDSFFVKTGVVFFASAGDVGALQSYPATSPNVVGVGGTSLVMDSSNTSVVSETAWTDSGGGPSVVETIPIFQKSITSVANQLGGMRGSPDISAIADLNTGVAVYQAGTWEIVGGTSVACPVCAGITNDWAAAQGFYEPSSTAENILIYSLLGTSHFRDIVSGTSVGARSFSAHAGWDFITGVGSPLNLEDLPTFFSFSAVSASTLSGNYISGATVSGGVVTSLATAGDNNFYVVNAQNVPNLGSVADVRAQFSVTGQPQSKIGGAIVTITGYSNTPNGVSEIFMYNYTTKTYDLVATPNLPTTDSAVSVTLTTAQALQYIDAAGDVVVLSRALLPERLILKSNTAYTYKVDQIQVSYGYIE